VSETSEPDNPVAKSRPSLAIVGPGARLWSGPLLLMVTFLSALTALMGSVNQWSQRQSRAELLQSTDFTIATIQESFNHDLEHLLMIAADSPDITTLQSTSGGYFTDLVVSGRGVNSMTLVEIDRPMVAVAEYRKPGDARTGSVVAPDRLSMMDSLVETGNPGFSDPYVGTDGACYFDLVVPVSGASETIGAIVATYSCLEVMNNLVPQSIIRDHWIRMVTEDGDELVVMEQNQRVRSNQVWQAPLLLSRSGIWLRFSPYQQVFWRWNLLLLMGICFILAIGISVVWGRSNIVSYLRKRAEISLRVSEERYRNLVEYSPLAVLVIQHDQLVFSNQAASVLFTASPGNQLSGYRLQELVHEDFHDRVGSLLGRILLDGKGDQLDEVKLIKQDGREVDAQITAIPFTYQDRAAIQLIIHDLTERNQAQEALRVSELQLRQSQKMEAIGRLAGGISHDFNNVLTAITGYSELMIQKMEADDPMLKSVREIEKSAQRASDLTSQLLAFSKQQELQPEVLDLNLVLRDMKGMLKRLLDADVSLEIRDYPEPMFLKVDRGQLTQVVVNLVVNAHQAMPQGGSLIIDLQGVEVDETGMRIGKGVETGSYVVLGVSDTGVGMDAETKRQVFEPFFTTKSDGTGLGLSTVYGIVSQSGGVIHLYSEYGEGTTFRLYFPRERTSEIADTGPGKKGTMPTGTENILLAEDDDSVRALACEILQSHGYTVFDARNATEAIRILQRNPSRIDLLLTDMVMPGMNGSELAAKIRQTLPVLKIIYCSGYADSALKQRGLLPADGVFIQKPFTMHSLLTRVREVLDA